jgi:hypothetical protein
MASSSRAEVSKWVFIIAIYVIVTGFIFSLGTSFTNDFNLQNNLTNTGFTAYTNQGKCYYSSDINSLTHDNNVPYVNELFNFEYDCNHIYMDRVDPSGNNFAESCENFNGCTSINETRWSWGSFAFIDTPICTGTINYASYGINDNGNGFCEWEGITNNKNNCLNFGCKWVESKPLNTSANVGLWGSLTGDNGATSFIGTLTGLDVNLQLPEPYQTYFNLIFVFIPRIILIFALVILIVG